jgi:hypothetical protein
MKTSRPEKIEWNKKLINSTVIIQANADLLKTNC